ncbi:IS110 family transposase [Dokdonella sp.]|uniref:IS110 family transposase n=1 Tax=Dokdonella sp. TaxID=2291710 RepID=UPI0025BE24D6|nr:IS110 family transposase [Dokdonella sp.]
MILASLSANATGRVQSRQEFKREAFGLWLAQVPAGTVVAMEACGGAHQWARRCMAYGLQPRITAAQFVRPFCKNPQAKNDAADAEANATAVRQDNMRFVPIKSVDQQVRLCRHRAREGYKVEHRALGNRIRGLLAEFGRVVPNTDAALRAALADLDHADLPASLNALIADMTARWHAIGKRKDACEAQIQTHAQADERCQRLRSILGVGALSADAMVATVGYRSAKSSWRLPTNMPAKSGLCWRMGWITTRVLAYTIRFTDPPKAREMKFTAAQSTHEARTWQHPIHRQRDAVATGRTHPERT